MKLYRLNKLVKRFPLERTRGSIAAFVERRKPVFKKNRQVLNKVIYRNISESFPERLTGDGLYFEVRTSDTLPSLIGKLRRIESLEIILKIPENANNFRELATWLRFSAYMKQSGQMLAVASTDPLIQQLAKTVGMPIASSEWYFGPSIRIRRLGRIYSKYFVRLGSLLVAVIFIWFGGGMILDRIAHAEIEVTPTGHERSVDVIFSVSDLIEDSDLLRRVVKARSVREETEATVIVAVTGMDSLGSERAIVNIEFVNSSSKNYSVASGFLVGTKEGINFRTTVSITLAPNESKQVAAVCDLPGTLGNVAASTITESTLPIEITAINSKAASGGIDKSWAIVDASDVLTAHRYSQNVLAIRGVKALSTLGNGELVTATVSTPILSQHARQAIGDPSEVFVIDYVIVASGLVVDFSEAERLVKMMLVSTLTFTEELVGLTQIDIIDAPELGNDKVRIRGTGRVIDTKDWAQDLSVLLRAASLQEATANLEEYLSLTEPPIITLSPSLLSVDSLPRLARNIRIQLLLPEYDLHDEKNNE
jgi:hypothetical protein